MQCICIEKRFAFRASEIADSRIQFNRWLLSPNRRAKKLTKITGCLPCQKYFTRSYFPLIIRMILIVFLLVTSLFFRNILKIFQDG